MSFKEGDVIEFYHSEAFAAPKLQVAMIININAARDCYIVKFPNGKKTKVQVKQHITKLTNIDKYLYF